MENKYLENAKIFKAFCDENRLMILEDLKDGEKCACILLEKLAISQPTLSHHMKILTESGMVQGRKEGKWIYYSLSAQGIEKAQKVFLSVTKLEENSKVEATVSC